MHLDLSIAEWRYDGSGHLNVKHMLIRNSILQLGAMSSPTNQSLQRAEAPKLKFDISRTLQRGEELP